MKVTSHQVAFSIIGGKEFHEIYNAFGVRDLSKSYCVAQRVAIRLRTLRSKMESEWPKMISAVKQMNNKSFKYDTLTELLKLVAFTRTYVVAYGTLDDEFIFNYCIDAAMGIAYLLSMQMVNALEELRNDYTVNEKRIRAAQLAILNEIETESAKAQMRAAQPTAQAIRFDVKRRELLVDDQDFTPRLNETTRQFLVAMALSRKQSDDIPISKDFMIGTATAESARHMLQQQTGIALKIIRTEKSKGYKLHSNVAISGADFDIACDVDKITAGRQNKTGQKPRPSDISDNPG